jgi:hypothetical protein
VCYEEAVLEMNIPIGDDDVKVEMSLKNERPPREGREATERCREESWGSTYNFIHFG